MELPDVAALRGEVAVQVASVPAQGEVVVVVDQESLAVVDVQFGADNSSGLYYEAVVGLLCGGEGVGGVDGHQEHRYHLGDGIVALAVVEAEGHHEAVPRVEGVVIEVGTLLALLLPVDVPGAKILPRSYVVGVHLGIIGGDGFWYHLHFGLWHHDGGEGDAVGDGAPRGGTVVGSDIVGGCCVGSHPYLTDALQALGGGVWWQRLPTPVGGIGRHADAVVLQVAVAVALYAQRRKRQASEPQGEGRVASRRGVEGVGEQQRPRVHGGRGVYGVSPPRVAAGEAEGVYGFVVV